MAYDYEISAAIYFMLDTGYDELIVDIPRAEDSLFFEDSRITALGEAKNWSGGLWTLEGLFHKGDSLGPVLQLWNRDKGYSKLAIFSTIGTKCPLRGKILSPDPKKLQDVIDKTQALAHEWPDREYTLEEVTTFLEKVSFYEWPHRTVKSQIHKWCRDHDVTIVDGGIERAIALFQDETYYSKKRIHQSEIINALSSETKKVAKPTKEYYTYTPVHSIPHSCSGRMAQRLNYLLDLYKRELRAEWFNPTTKVNDIALRVLKGRIESLKDAQEECGNEFIASIIHELESNPQLLFKEDKNGEQLRKIIRKLIAKYRSDAKRFSPFW